MALSMAAMAPTGAQALAVPLEGIFVMSAHTDCSPWCGGSEAQANVTANDGHFVGGQFTGGAGIATSAILGGGGWLGKTAAATASFGWKAIVHRAPEATTDPFEVYLDWSTMLFASHDALFGQASGGSQFRVTWSQCLPTASGCTLSQTFDHERVYTDSITYDDVWDLGTFDSSAPYGLLEISYAVGSAAATAPLVGFYASAIDIGVYSFTLRGDDGRATPVGEPPTLAMVFGGLLAASALRASRKRRS